MKQILQNLSTGQTSALDVPAPGPRAGHLLIATDRSLISAGTERTVVNFGRANWVDKARQQPEKVRQVLDKVRTDGIAPTVQSVRNKLDQPLPLGYSNVGTVVSVGPGVSGFEPGDRVVSNGRHAEVVVVPANLCAKVPPTVTSDSAAFAVVGAIALQGIRLAAPTLGEAVAVIGLGLIGLIAVQLLKAQGNRVLGIDFDLNRLALARELGAETVHLASETDPVPDAIAFSRGRGIDAVLITAATDSNDPVRHAARMSRKRGRIVLVGVAGLALSRSDFYEKELTFQVSCSYGPGRYDPAYEEGGQDYPVGFIRWTEQRNFEAVLDMIADRRIDVERLITHRFKIADAESAYDVVAGSDPSLGILLEYSSVCEESADRILKRTLTLGKNGAQRDEQSLALSVIGAGSYGTAVLLPAFRDSGCRFRTIASSGGVSGAHAARKFGFEQTTTDASIVIDDPNTEAVVIATRHDTHAHLVVAALEAGKHVFVEKPLCLTLDELEAIRHAYWKANGQTEGMAHDDRARCHLMVGFNRRFAPQVQRIKALLDTQGGPNAFVLTVNAGPIAPDHWTQDPRVGGGRIIGEACHFVDLLRFLSGAPIAGHGLSRLQTPTRDSVSINLEFANGSIGTVHYFANGSKSFPKERLEVFAGGGILQLDNFRRLSGFGWPGFRSLRLFKQDKGQRACARAFVDAVTKGQPTPIPIDEVIEVARVVIELSGSDASATSVNKR